MFRFRLEKVRRWRQRLEDRQAHALKDALEVLRQARAEVRRQRELIADLERQDGAPGDLQFLILRAAWRQRLQDELNELLRRESEAATAVQARRVELTEAHRRREVMDRLEENQRLRWEDEQARRDLRELDEIAGVRAARRLPRTLA